MRRISYPLIGAGAVVAASSFVLKGLLKSAEVDLELTDEELEWDDEDTA